MARQQSLSNRSAISRMVLLTALNLSWPLRLAHQAGILLQRWGSIVRQQAGVTHLQQSLQLLWLGLAHGLPPRNYYQLQLFRPDRRAQLGHFLFDHEMDGLVRGLSHGHIDPAISNKRLFAERCDAAGLPHSPTLAWGVGKAITMETEVWPGGDLVSKPCHGCRGEGVRFWQWMDSEHYRSIEGALWSRSALLDFLTLDENPQGWLLQPALKTHPDLMALSPGSLLSVRMMTARPDKGPVTPFAALLKMPIGRQMVNNHGIASAVDLESGRLYRAYPYRPLHSGFEHHPSTGATIAGQRVPDWSAVVELALRAHDQFADTCLLGWDIAITPSGPILLETNSNFDVTLPQIAYQAPLADSLLATMVERF